MGRQYEDSGYEDGQFDGSRPEDIRRDESRRDESRRDESRRDESRRDESRHESGAYDAGRFEAEPKPASWDEMPVGPEPDENDRLLALVAHLSIFVLGVIGPLVIWLIKKDESPFLEDQAKEALNFQLAVLIVSLVLGVTCIGLLVLPVVIVGSMIYAILAALDANQGKYYRYPYTIRLIK